MDEELIDAFKRLEDENDYEGGSPAVWQAISDLRELVEKKLSERNRLLAWSSWWENHTKRASGQ